MIVGVTGGPGTGKSLVSREFKRCGAVVVDADEIARTVIVPGKAAYREILREFGKDVINPDGSINRRLLGRIVFFDKKGLKRLNSITHPRIIREIQRRIKQYQERKPDSLIVLDAPLLIETGLHKKMDTIVVVCAKREKQLERIKEKYGITKREALSRIRAQMPLKEKLGFADFVIDNNGTKQGAMKETRRLYLLLTRRKLIC